MSEGPNKTPATEPIQGTSGDSIDAPVVAETARAITGSADGRNDTSLPEVPPAEGAPVEGPSEEVKNISRSDPEVAAVEGQPNRRSAPAENRHLFGLKTKAVYTGQQDFSDDYEKRFPEDPMLEETGPNARVWRTYLVESTAFDENMVGEARDGLDAMLVFAGLFSAVVTSFLVQTSESLQPDYTEISASLLSELIAVQRAAANGSSVNAVPVAALNPNTRFIPETLDVWVNGLWVVSLTLSLVVALAAVLIKQWLHRYVAFHSGTPKERSHIRHSKFIGFETWQVLGIIGSLPVIMHLSLAFFLLGLFIFLIPLQLVLSCIIGALAFLAYGLYLASNILPVFIPHCPYQTPLSDFIVACSRSVRVHFLQIWGLIRGRGIRLFIGVIQKSIPAALQIGDDDDEFTDSKAIVTGDVGERLSVQALYWLFKVSTNPSVHSVVLQAIGGFPATAAVEVREAFNHENTQYVRRFTDTYIEGYLDTSTIKPGSEASAERLMRACLMCGLDMDVPFSSDHLAAAGIRTWEEPDPSQDRRYLATALVLSRKHPFALAPRDFETISSLYTPYILSHHNTPHHPLVWENLLQGSMEWDAFDEYPTNLDLFRILFPALFGRPDSKGHSSDLQTMVSSLHLDNDLQQKLCGHLLRRVSVGYDAPGNCFSVSGNAAEILLMQTLEHAFYRLSAESANLEIVHWQIINETLSHNFYNFYNMRKQQHMQMFFKIFIARLIQHTDIFCSRSLEPALLERRRITLTAYLRGTWGEHAFYEAASTYISWGNIDWHAPLVSARTPDDEPLFLCAIDQPLSDIRLIDIDEHYELVRVIFSILASGLLDGLTPACTLAVKYDCLELARKCAAHHPHLNPLVITLASTFAIGLVVNTAANAETRKLTLDYLFKTQNLCFVTISYIEQMMYWVSSTASERIIRNRVYELVRLRPDQGAWGECRHWLSHVLDWVIGGGKKEELQNNQELGDERVLESIISSTQDLDIQQVIEQFIRLLNEFLESPEIIHEQLLDHPDSDATPPGAVLAQAEKTKRWTLHELLWWRKDKRAEESV